MPDQSYDENVTTDLLACAIAVAEYTDGDEFADLMEIVATQQSRNGELDAAIERAETIPDPYLRDRTVGTIAVYSLEQGDSQLALELVNSIEDPMMHETYVEQIALKAAGDGRFDEAIQIANGLGDPSPVLSNIASVLGKQGHMQEAVDLTRSIETVGIRVSTLNHLAAELAKSGSQSEALQLVQEGAGEIDDIEFPEDQIHALVGMAIVYDALGEKGNGFDKLVDAYKICRSLPGSDPASVMAKDETLIEIVGGFGELKFFEKADQILEEVDGPFQFAQAGIRLAHSYFRDEKETEAEELLAQAVEICKEEKAFSEQGIRIKHRMFAELAAAYAIHKRFDKAIAVIQLVTIAEDSRPIMETVGLLAARAKEHDVVARVAALQTEPSAKGAYWNQIADAYAGVDDSESVSNALVHAVRTSQSIELVYDRVLVIGAAAARSSDQSSRLFQQAISLIPEIEGYYRQARALLALAPDVTKVGHRLGESEQQALKTLVNRLD